MVSTLHAKVRSHNQLNHLFILKLYFIFDLLPIICLLSILLAVIIGVFGKKFTEKQSC